MIALIAAGALLAQDAPHNWMTPPAIPQESNGRMVYLKGNVFLDQCASSEVACILYIQGVNDALFAAISSTSRDLPYCIPEGSTPRQVYMVVRLWMERNPAALHRPAAALIAQALSEAWPQCGT